MKWFMVSVITLTAILFIVKSLVLIDLFTKHGSSVIEGIKVVFFILPTFLSVTIPPSLFLATLISFAGFSVENEYTAMRTSGWQFFFLMKPIYLISLIGFFATILVVFYFLPMGTNSLKMYLFDVFQKRANIEMKSRVFHKDFPGYVLFFKNLGENGKLLDLFVSSHQKGEPHKIIYAKEGILIPNSNTLKIHLKMTNGVVHETDISGEGYSTANFENFNLLIAFPEKEKLINDVLVGGVTVNESSIGEIWQNIKKGEREGRDNFWDKVVLSRKFSIPFSCLLFGLAGVPLGIGKVRSGRYGIYLKGLIIAGIYYFSMMVVQKSGAVGVINPYLSVWIPNFLLAAFTFYVLLLARRDDLEPLNSQLWRIYEKIRLYIIKR